MLRRAAEMGMRAGSRDGRGAGSTHRKAWPCPRRCSRLIVAGCERRDRLPSTRRSRRGVVGFNSGFGHGATSFPFWVATGMEPRTWGFPRGARRSGRSGSRRQTAVRVFNSPAQLTKKLAKSLTDAVEKKRLSTDAERRLCDERWRVATRASVRRLEVGVAHGARVRQDVADVAHAGEVHHQALEAQTVAACLQEP